MTETAFDGSGYDPIIVNDLDANGATGTKLAVEELAQRNPFFGSAATLNEIHVGVKLLVVHWNGYAFIAPEVRTVTSEPHSGLNSEQFGLLTSYDCARGSGRDYLSNIGVTPRCYGDERWNQFYVSVVNTAENRYRLVIELLFRQHKNRQAWKAAKAIAALYSGQFRLLNID